MLSRQVSIASAMPGDMPELEAVHRAAFGGELEARLVRLLVRRGVAVVSLKAVLEGSVAGHVVFSSATCEMPAGELSAGGGGCGESLAVGLGLGPLAVVPAQQRLGVGSALVRAGIAACRRLGAAWIVVLGEPAHYGRFGFTAANRYGVSGEFGGGEAFQVLVLDAERPPVFGGVIRYAAEFREVFSL